MHRLLKRQIKRHLGDLENFLPEWQSFFEAVSDAYQQFDDDRLMLERSMELSSKELLEVNSQMRAAIPDLFLRLDAHGTILDYQWGDGIKTYTPLEDPVGKRFQEFLPKAIAKQFDSAIKEVLEVKPIISVEHSLTINERQHFYEARLMRLTGKQIITVIRDISSRKQAEQALQQAKEAADAANIAKSRFLAKMSHELRTPLNAILGFTQLMGRDNSLSAEHREHLQIINRSGEHLLSLINEVLDLSKIEAGQVNIITNNFDLHHLLENVAAMLQIKADSKKLQLLFELDSYLPQYVKTDEGKLRQTLVNLIGNAIKFTDRGGVSLRVKIKDINNKTDGGILHFEVEDTGRGIPPEEIEKVFESFVQSSQNRDSQEGTGLGLSISRQFVRLLGGEMTVTSRLGEGTVFSFYIPVKIVDAAEIEEKSHQRRVIAIAPEQPAYRILIVEDRLENRQLLNKLLRSVGFEVREAYNGAEAVDLWQTWHPHLIWMDMQMPVMNGYEATQTIRQQEKGLGTKEKKSVLPNVTIIALTASAFEEEREIVLSAGCNDFVRKPFRQEVIFDKIARYLGVQYLYDGEEQEGETPIANLTQSPETMQVQLGEMSADWLQGLHQAAVEADSEAIEHLLTEIPPTATGLAYTLKDWVADFQFEQIAELIQPFL